MPSHHWFSNWSVLHLTFKLYATCTILTSQGFSGEECAIRQDLEGLGDNGLKKKKHTKNIPLEIYL